MSVRRRAGSQAPDRVHRINRNENSVTTEFSSPIDSARLIDVKRSISSEMRWSGLSVVVWSSCIR